MNETEVKKMLTAAQAYIVYLEKKEQELWVKSQALARRSDQLEVANNTLANSNEDLAAKLNYFRACNDNQANLIIKLREEQHYA
jgi:hypothetical protein